MKRLSLLMALLTSLVTLAQNTENKTNNERPIIGLCLSGGSARGFSHIGVIAILDSLNIPIDYVAGTSMGSIIGGLYAIGYEPDQIADEVSKANWGDLMNPNPKRKYESYSSKDHGQRNIFTVGIKDWDIVLPTGLNNASKVYQKLHNATIGYHGEQNFLEFPRGFVCISANLNTGEELVYKSGSLPDAMRSSMSLPTMFTPHVYKGKTTVDGGTINNFPTDKLKELGCDIIIGVDLSTMEIDTLTISLTNVLEKTAMFINTKNMEERRSVCDVLIKPDLTGYTSAQFDEGAGMIERGKQAGRAHLPALTKLAARLNKYQVQKIPRYSKPDSIMISSVNVKGLNWVSEKYILGMVDFNPGELKAISDLEKAVSAMYGSDYFENIVYNLYEQTNEDYVLEVSVKEKSTNANLGFGLHYDPDFETSFLINLQIRNALIKGSRFNLDAVVSPRPRFKLLYEVDRGFKPGFGVRSDLYFTKPSFYENTASLGSYTYDDWTTGIYALFSLHNLAVLRAGAEFNYAFINFKDVPALREILDSNYEQPSATVFEYTHLNLFTEIGIDILDNNNYPTKGHKFFGVIKYHTSALKNQEDVLNNHFMTVFARYNSAYSPNSWLSFLPEIVGGFTMLNDPSFIYSFKLGGLGKNYFNYQTAFLGYRYSERPGLDNLLVGGLEMRFKAFKKHYLSGLFNYGGSFTTINSIQEPAYDEFEDFTGLGVKYSLNSFIGPVEVTAHKNLNGGGWLFYFNLGYWF